jgi:tripartite-type tricarboxylate transporter receptor subunit TctC
VQFGSGTPDTFTAFIRDELGKYDKLVKELGVKAD